MPHRTENSTLCLDEKWWEHTCLLSKPQSSQASPRVRPEPPTLPPEGPARDAGRPGGQSWEAQTPRAPATPAPRACVAAQTTPRAGPTCPRPARLPTAQSAALLSGAVKKTLPRKPANSSPVGSPTFSGRPEPPSLSCSGALRPLEDYSPHLGRASLTLSLYFSASHFPCSDHRVVSVWLDPHQNLKNEENKLTPKQAAGSKNLFFKDRNRAKVNRT